MILLLKEAAMNIIDILPGQYKKSGNKNGGEFSGSCPWCGDGGKGQDSDRFRVWPGQGNHGTYWCRMCGKAGDAIKYLIDHEGLQFKDALARLGLSVDILAGRAKIPAGWQAKDAAAVSATWAEHALKFVDWCHARLLERMVELGWLAARGITLEMVQKYRLGWNPTHAWREGSAWGIELGKKEDGKAKKLWLPRGLVIPCFAEGGAVQRLRIRQPDGAPRYLVVPGSNREPLITREASAMIIVESELDAILLDTVAGDLVGVVAMGNDTAKPTAGLLPILTEALWIGVALDSDLPRFNADNGSLDMPGAKASRWWLQQFDTAERVPIIGGKDPGDAFAMGFDLRLWVQAALPPYFHVKAELDQAKAERIARIRAAAEAELMAKEAQKLAALEDLKPRQVAVQQEDSKKMAVAAPSLQGESRPVEAERPADETGAPPATAREIVLADGRSFLVTADQAEWERLSADGHVVFSENELKRLQEACRNMSPQERHAAAMLALEVKEVFGPAWIKRGEALQP
jgi:DNA primase